jgi:hypothetical protein
MFPPNAWVIRAGKEKVTMSNKRASPASDQPIVPRPPRIGDRIRITKDIDWDGEDCHPPCTLAYKGDLMHVRRIRGYNVMACHNLLDESTMLVQQGEYEIVNENDHENDCPRCQGSGEVTTADYESYFGQNYKPCPMCGGNGDR